MQTLYLICAVVGGTLFLCQLVLLMLGGGGDHDVDADHDTTHGHSGGESLFWGLLSFRAIVSAIACFGLAGKVASLHLPVGPMTTFAIAIAAGFAAMVLVAFVLRMMLKMTADGTENIQNARGSTGTVYLTIPGDRAGLGKVTLELQNRTIELQAVTYQHSISTGTKVIVTDVISPDTVEVIAAPQMGTQYV